jgi:hypothetical protein
MSVMMSLSITAVMGCVLDAGFLCDKALMLRDTVEGTPVYAITLQSIHVNSVIFIPI